MVYFVKRVIRRIKHELFPSEERLMARKWQQDGGDYAFRFKYNLNQNSIVFDLGGYEGQWASDIFSRYCCNVYIFEPVQSFSDGIKKRFEKNKKIKVFKFGLGGNSRTAKISISADGSSLFRDSADVEEISIIDIKCWLEKQSISHIDLIKINIEGGEYELLDRLIDTDLIGLFDNVQVQFHNLDKDSKSHMISIGEALAKTHELTYQYPFVWENWKLKKVSKN